VDDIGDVTITNDGATILKQLEVEHPAAKVLVDLAHLQDNEVGDGTTSVVIVAAELLKRANELVKNNIHPTTIISGYRIAMRECLKFIQANLSIKVDQLEQDSLSQIARTSLSSKFVGGSDEHVFSRIVVDAVRAVKFMGFDGKAKYPVGQINVIKSHGQSSAESMLLPNGYALKLGRASQATFRNTRRLGFTTGLETSIRDLDFFRSRNRNRVGVEPEVDGVLARGVAVVLGVVAILGVLA
ncbi:unnamed protein product, partial [Prorocentrum cordatum]